MIHPHYRLPLENTYNHAQEDGYAEQPPIPFHAESAMWRFTTKLPGDESIVVEIIVGQVKAVSRFFLLPRFFAQLWEFFLTPRTRLAHADFSIAEGTAVTENLWHDKPF